jgi:hypothetical protein
MMYSIVSGQTALPSGKQVFYFSVIDTPWYWRVLERATDAAAYYSCSNLLHKVHARVATKADEASSHFVLPTDEELQVCFTDWAKRVAGHTNDYSTLTV